MARQIGSKNKVLGPRAAAKAAGLPRYFTGESCVNGHVAERRTANNWCVECQRAAKKAHPAYGQRDQARRNLRRDTDPVFAERLRTRRAASERIRRQRDDVKAVRAAERMKRIASLKQRTPAWADGEKIAAFYRLAAAFSKLYVPHHVDHIYPLNGETVSGLHVEDNLRVIPAEDNLRKGADLPMAA
jgi:hypothetical protein